MSAYFPGSRDYQMSKTLEDLTETDIRSRLEEDKIGDWFRAWSRRSNAKAIHTYYHAAHEWKGHGQKALDSDWIHKKPKQKASIEKSMKGHDEFINALKDKWKLRGHDKTYGDINQKKIKWK